MTPAAPETPGPLVCETYWLTSSLRLKPGDSNRR